jgi:hypothetical protein
MNEQVRVSLFAYVAHPSFCSPAPLAPPAPPPVFCKRCATELFAQVQVPWTTQELKVPGQHKQESGMNLATILASCALVLASLVLTSKSPVFHLPLVLCFDLILLQSRTCLEGVEEVTCLVGQVFMILAPKHVSSLHNLSKVSIFVL